MGKRKPAKATVFSKNLSRRLTECGISQAELAGLIDRGKNSISEYVAGRHLPNSDVLMMISRALNSTPNDLLGFKREDCKHLLLTVLAGGRACKVCGSKIKVTEVQNREGKKTT